MNKAEEIPVCKDHDFTQFEEEYYGYRCPKCRMFIPFGCEPWVPEQQEPDSDYCEADDVNDEQRARELSQAVKTEYQFITFVKVLVSPARKTSIWSCQNTKSGSELGRVQWYGAWRQYCYFPTAPAVYSVGCLKDINHFIGQLEETKGIK